MARTLLVAGTASHVGKSTVVAGLCRLLARRGLDVAPFKAQNMSNNARVALTPTGDWGEIGVSQYVQARAARTTPTTDLNPVLLKPRGGGESQLVIDGRAQGHYGSADFYESHWDRARTAAEEAYRRLATGRDSIVAEGAGSPAEVNLQDRDLANIETARFADADILLVADIERGGAFASLYGTIELLPADLRARVVGAVINKFRGDRSLLDGGPAAIEADTGVPVLGVLPYDDPGLPAEDSVSLPDTGSVVLGDNDVPKDRTVTVVVPRLPRISNVPDIDPLTREPGVRVRIAPLDTDLDGADAVLLPGTKNAVDDLLALREAGFDDSIAAFDGPVVGLCGGYQLLGTQLVNAGIESPGDRDVVEGLGLLPVETRYEREKHVRRATYDLHGAGPLAGGKGPVSGYEIHMGVTRPTAPVASPVGDQSAATDDVVGTYLHGLFENDNAREAFVETVFSRAGISRPERQPEERAPCDRAADLLAEHLDLGPLRLPSTAGSSN